MEANLIGRFFVGLGATRPDVRLGIGDDAAVVAIPAGHELVLSTDALVEGVHFVAGADARSLGHRALAVNLSDLAAMGAEPAWALLSLNLPAFDETWLAGFAAGFGALARAHGVALVGGNLSRGPLSITVQIAGCVPAGEALRRAGAAPGDQVFVSGTPGDAAAGCAQILGGTRAVAPALVERFEFPQPRVELGLALRGVASACIDLSDGLYTDLARLCAASACGARIDVDSLPLSSALRALDGERAWQRALGGGEDYELCFTVPAARRAALESLLTKKHVMCTRIGQIEQDNGVQIVRAGSVIAFTHAGFDHFR